MGFDDVSCPVLAKKFSAPDFNAEDYVKGVLAKCDIYRTIYDQRNNIQQLGEETAVSLKKNVYRNYRQFIDTAKEISYLEAEMYQLSHLLTEQKSTLAEQISTDIFERPKGLPVQKDPEVEAYQEKKKNFLDNIKASKQLLNELAVKELFLDGELTEFDPETYSPIQKIGAYLLTDNLLITSLPGDGKLTILNMFDLSDLAVVNVRDGQGVKNAFKVLYSLETRMFGAPSKDLKLAWLDQIERAKKNYRKGVPQLPIDSHNLVEVKENEEESEEESEEDEEKKETEVKPELYSPIGYPNLLNVEWLIELPEDLDMCIAQRDFEGAVKLVEKVRMYLMDFPESSALAEVRRKIEIRVQQLEAALEKSLDNSSSSRHVSLRSIRIYVLLLIRLGRAKLACELFLRNRGFEIKNSFKQLKMEGATVIYIQKLASVFFTAIIETGKEYMKNFPLNNNCSAFIVWVHNELKYFSEKFSRQVFLRNCTLSSIGGCINIAITECKRLETIGIDLVFDLQHMLLKDIMSTIFDARDQLFERIKIRVAEDNWENCDYSGKPVELQSLKDDFAALDFIKFESYIKNDEVVILSSSTLIFSKAVLTFFEECVRLYTAEIHNVFMQCLSEIFKAQSIQFEMVLKDPVFKSKTHFVLLNAEFVYGRIFEMINKKVAKIVGHNSNVLTGIKDEMERLRKFALLKH